MVARRSAALDELHAAPGNPGIAALAHCHPVRADDPAALVSLARELRIDLVVVGPEAPLVAGLADELRLRGIAVFGPERRGRPDRGLEGVREGRDGGCRRARRRGRSRSPGRRASSRPTGSRPARASGSAAPRKSSTRRSRAAQALGQPFHVEELLEGAELSLFALAAGEAAVAASAGPRLQADRRRRHRPEHRRHGLVLAAADVADDEAGELVETVHLPVLAELAAGAARRS